MSVSLWDWTSALANGQILTTDECDLLLDTDFSDDLLKTFPGAGPKLESTTPEHYPHQEDTSSSLYPQSPSDTKPDRAQLASDLLQQLDHQCKQENIFSNWLEEKVELAIFDGITPAQECVEVPHLPEASYATPVPAVPYSAPQHTEELLREFDTVYGVVELTHLTPPQSPPGPATQLLLSYAQQAQCVPPAPHDTWQLSPSPLPQDQPQLDLELHNSSFEVLLGTRAAQFASPQGSSCSASVSPQSSPPSSPRSSSADEDWASGSSRPKPYSRSGDDRHSRKKEQNKNAATRYRQKKKAEVEVLLTEEHSLRQRHSELGTKRADLQREIRYLKGLMRELFKAKGLIK